MGATTSRPSKVAWPQWEYDVIRALGGTVTTPKLIVLNLWNRVEGMPDDTNNWLAFTAPTSDPNEWGATGTAPGNTQDIAPGQWNSFHDNEYEVTTYATQSGGVSALVKFMNAGHQGIVAAFQDDNATISSLTGAIAADGGWGQDGAKIAALSGTTPSGELKVGVYGQGQTGDPATTGPQGSAGFYQCKSANVLIGGGVGPLRLNLLNACQAKALVGGLLVGVGGLIFAGGIVVIAIASPLGSSAIPSIVDKSPIGRVSSALQSRGKKVDNSTPPTVTAPAPKPTVVVDERQAARDEWSRTHGMRWEDSPAGQRASRAAA